MPNQVVAGVDANGIERVLLVDASGRPLVTINTALPAGTNNIGDVDVLTMPVTHVISDAGNNNIGDVDVLTMPTVVIKPVNSGSLFAIESDIGNNLENLTLSAGVNNLDSSAVPTGKIWIITSIVMIYTGTVATVILRAQLIRSSTIIRLFGVNTPTSGLPYDRQGHWVLMAGDVLRMSITNATLNDDAEFSFTGWQQTA
jgi:hypothetical protein